MEDGILVLARDKAEEAILEVLRQRAGQTGPGSSLALGREAYERGAINAADLVDTFTFTYAGFLRLLGKPRFRQLVRQEWKESVSRRAEGYVKL